MSSPQVITHHGLPALLGDRECVDGTASILASTLAHQFMESYFSAFFGIHQDDRLAGQLIAGPWGRGHGWVGGFLPWSGGTGDTATRSSDFWRRANSPSLPGFASRLAWTNMGRRAQADGIHQARRLPTTAALLTS